MNTKKPIEHSEARQVFERVIAVLLDLDEVANLDATVHPDFMGYGSAAHEFFRTREEMKKMARMQSEQLKTQQFKYARRPISEKTFAGGQACLILEEFQLFFPDSDHELHLRLTTILEKLDGTWLVTHFHGSSPDSDIAEDEAFPMEGLRKKNEELEAKIRERTRELEIGAALERTRAQSMQMQHSSELSEVSKVFHEQLHALGIASDFSFVWLPNEAAGDHLFWAAWMEPAAKGPPIHTRAITYPLDKTEPYTAACFADWESGIPVHEHFVQPEDLETFFAAWEELLNGATRLKAKYFPQGIYYTEAFIKYGCFGVDTREPLTGEEKSILHRFAIEFERTYTRFLDLKKAEAQAREAEIEVALERVRSRSMAMQNSGGLKEVIRVIFDQLAALQINAEHAGIVVDYSPGKDWTFWVAETQDIPSKISVPYLDSVWDRQYTTAKEKGTDFFTTALGFEEKNTFYEELLKHIPGLTEETREFYLTCPGLAISTTVHKDIGLYIENFSGVPYSEEENTILRRFGTVFQQTYTRFLDLQKAEAQAREARVETALERVRSRTMAMQHSDELTEASHLLDKEVRGLGIQTWGCAFNIYRDEDSIEWFGNEAGLLPTYTVPREGIFKEYYERGQKGETLFIREFSGEECIAHYEYMSTLPVVGDVLKKLKETNGSFPTFQIDHVVYFKYGYLLFITRQAVAESYDIFRRFAKVFEQTYTRFLDLQLKEEQAVKLVEEKQRLERTLADLQATQQQLIHAEKMASLGELTAGIAHEIQNPLNFVNNFSEVSRELLEEMIDELKKGDAEESDAIARDVIRNLEKIMHHGKRADSIVKGMLQHSRRGEGKKEPADLNALADEYFRLAYHGLRAKDNAFHASMETDFDHQIGLVEVVPQDIGRVLLNIITNAFHAVNEREQKEGGGYEPRVWVRTRKRDDGVEISIRDNGSGIPAGIREKIFQPFFTTKPTGEGTGLGLSMSYDIIKKGHGGELKMQSSEGEGSEFTIKVPLGR